jgi:hypothetical protein
MWRMLFGRLLLIVCVLVQCNSPVTRVLSCLHRLLDHVEVFANMTYSK